MWLLHSDLLQVRLFLRPAPLRLFGLCSFPVQVCRIDEGLDTEMAELSREMLSVQSGHILITESELIRVFKAFMACDRSRMWPQ